MADWPSYARIRPIQQWPGESTRNRKRSNFSASWQGTLNLLTRELDFLGRKNVVIQLALTEQDIRLDGFPRANARPEHPGVIISLDSKHGPLSYPCDTFPTWQDNVRAIALALESLRSVDRYGVTKRGEQYSGWKQLPAGTPMPAAMTREDAAAFIGKHGPFDPSAVLLHWPYGGRYYRVCAQKLHPDAGGSAEAFQQLQEAKRVLDGAQ